MSRLLGWRAITPNPSRTMTKLETLLHLATLVGEDGPRAVGSPAVGPPDPFVGKPVLVRSHNAGVLFGDCVAIDGQDVTLESARQVWSWKAAKGGTVVDLANDPPAELKLSYTARQLVRVVESCTVLVCSESAADAFRANSSEGKWK